MSKIIRYSAFFLILINPVIIFSQECNDAILATTSHLKDNRDGMISDSKTGLVWKKCNEGQRWNSATNDCDGSASNYNWQATLQRAENVNKGSEGENFGKNNWRIPNIRELTSIVELKCWNPAINISVFPSAPKMSPWSSSPSDDHGGAWHVDFDFGYQDASSTIKINKGHVRLVRSGQ